MSHFNYTGCGIAAIFLWGAMIGLMRTVAEAFGPIGGAALLYTIAALFLILVLGVPKRQHFSLRYLLIGGGLFVSYEICLALAIGMANSRHQALEMAVINYLWPAITVVLAVILSKKTVSVWLYPSVGLAFTGVVWTLTGDAGFSITHVVNNIASNPLTYGLAFMGAVIWAIYCNVTKLIAKGQNAIALFFIATAMVLWIKYALSQEGPLSFSPIATFNVILTGVVMGSGYALWNIAILRGNMLLLATLSYFTPVISTLFSSLILGVILDTSFWQGVAMVTLGSLLCWWLTRDKPKLIEAST
ncbi:aromatic amino acid DMT transporter YddG [Vibrio metschnikovii]|uniref:aromatic amino acid DMT transporter YddG n=1 Tax=Vibrio metschnikovii TaxID=28172 RepID=UPI001C30B403|nr:aromatic amino acid DMT transporter YddG [Vibrio metschnikovii]